MRLLDLFCGAGGASTGYHMAGFDIVGVDIKPQPNYPFEFHQANALEYPIDGFDAIHASPPCQKFSMMQRIHKNEHKHPDLITPIRNRINKKPYVIENVPGAPLRVDLLLCGTMFGLRIARHRIFESNSLSFSLMPPCNHVDLYDPWHGGEMARGEREKLSKAMGIEYFMTRPEVREAIPPAYTEYIGKQLIRNIKDIEHHN